ncbi:MAG: BamA/TamA family outer membrane protein [Flavobacterium sp.]|nr:BamA/TamA family outer membrane protein [Candidatus Neoflavobacterium equi]
MNRYLSFIIFVLATSITSCSGLKAVPEGSYLYSGSKIQVLSDSLSKGNRKGLQANLNDLLRPKPNKKFLGMRPKLFFYHLAGEPKKEKGFRFWLRNKVGEAPVLMEQFDLKYNAELLDNYAENRGFFNVSTTFDTVQKKKTAAVNYQVNVKQQFLIRLVTFPSDTTVLAREIAKTQAGSLLKMGNPYNLETIKQERVRIDNELKNKGYYFFNPDYLLIQADSTVGRNLVDLNLKVKQETPDLARYPFTIDKIVVFADYNVRRNRYKKEDILAIPPYKNFIIVDPKQKFKNHIYDRTLYFDKGDLYNRNDHNLSLNRLVNLGVFKFVKNQFYVTDSTNHVLATTYMLTPTDMKSLRFETTGKTNSASYTGFEVNLNWRHRNFFKGAELFTFSAYTGLDFQLGKKNKGYDVYRFGTEANLVWPRIIAPFKFSSSSWFVPKTKLTISHEYQFRKQLYALNSFNASFGYGWKETIEKEHELKVLDVSYVSPSHVTEQFLERTQENEYDARILKKQLTFGPIYSYTFTNTMKTTKKHTFYYKGMLDLSANITGLVMGANKEKDKEKYIFGVPFSQYAKIDNDFRYYYKIDDRQSFATRIAGGIAYPYGNSDEVPFVKQFFVGGTNSIRAFRTRTLGPGSFNPNESTSKFLLEQSGDIKLEASVEYRAKLFSIVSGALFLDAGNVWLLNANDARPGGEFTKDFYKEIAVGAGFGLRFDVSILILRLDLAFPIRVPYYPENERWTYDKVDFGDKQWRKDNLILNIAIGYPF